MRVKGEIFMYTVEKFEKEINVKEYVEDYVNVEEFLEYCKACPNYEKVWSCPSYDFSPIDYWNRYSRIYIVARKIIFDDDTNVEDPLSLHKLQLPALSETEPSYCFSSS